MTTTNPFLPFLDRNGTILLDGGLATTLEAAGYSLQDDLWSARLLLEDPQAIRGVHEAFLRAGADCIVTASYQATIAGFRARGLSESEAEFLLQLSVQLGLDAREAFVRTRETSATTSHTDALAPLVAASIGPYGASLADGSEYHGSYGLTDGALTRFHEGRWGLLAASRADLLACETIPSKQEVYVLLELLRQSASSYAWLSVTCQDGKHLRDGSALADVFEGADDLDNLVAVGVNCTAPQHVASCIREIRSVTHKTIIVYPNSGENFDATQRSWVKGDDTVVDWGVVARQWLSLGAQGVGGCCRVGPAEVRAMHQALNPESS